MPLFMCRECKHIENTALCDFWPRRERICSHCNPNTEWHGRFKRYSANGYWVGRNGFLYSTFAILSNGGINTDIVAVVVRGRYVKLAEPIFNQRIDG